MTESAHESRRRATAKKAAAFARAHTVAAGLSSFTVEQICEAAGFSRRTFFNYFASKEDAVLGILLPSGDEDLEDAFVVAHGDLLDDLITLSVALWDRHSLSIDDVEELGAVIDVEPKLLARLFSHVKETEIAASALVARRCGYDTEDPRATTIAQIVATLMRLAIDDALQHPETADFENFLRARVAIARELFSATTHTKAQS